MKKNHRHQKTKISPMKDPRFLKKKKNINFPSPDKTPPPPPPHHHHPHPPRALDESTHVSLSAQAISSPDQTSNELVLE